MESLTGHDDLLCAYGIALMSRPANLLLDAAGERGRGHPRLVGEACTS
jgi:hypothetical protein